MRLYYMTDLIVAQIVLREHRMKLSLFQELNDPFELLGVSLGEKNVRRLYQAVRKHYEESTGILCFTDNWKDPVTWAHYGNKHYGVCLGFDIPDELTRKVDYQPDRLKHVIVPNTPLLGLDREKLEAVMLSKYAGWSYEKEYRVFSRLEEKDQKTGFYYVDFGKDMELAEVILGSRCIKNISEVAKEFTPCAQKIIFRQARVGFTKYEIVSDVRVKPLYV